MWHDGGSDVAEVGPSVGHKELNIGENEFRKKRSYFCL